MTVSRLGSSATVILLATMAGVIAFAAMMALKSGTPPVASMKSAGSVARTAAPPRDETPFHETYVVFADKSQAPIIETDRDARSGYEVSLSHVSGGANRLEATVTGPSGMSRTLPVRDAAGAWANLFGDGDPIMFRVAKYWPDFAMKGGVPVSVSEQPRNPAVLVQITGPTKLLPAPAAPASP
jgi:hypothetical protein